MNLRNSSSVFRLAPIFLVLVLELKDFCDAYERSSVDGDLCPPTLNTQNVKLHRNSLSALELYSKRLGDHKVLWAQDFLCNIQIEAAPNDNGVFAVIQKLDFRRKPGSFECLDYVRYKHANGTPATGEICGRIEASYVMDKNNVMLASHSESTPNAYIAVGRKFSVEIFVSREPLKGDERFNFFIVFTSYKYCELVDRTQPYERCGDHKQCIDKSFFGDGRMNCPYMNCPDEGGCHDGDVTYQESNPGTGTKAAIGAVSALLISFFVFATCLWLCRKYGKLCWAQEFAHPEQTQSQDARVIEMESEAPRAQPSSPPPVDEDKDLPPSYDSLFPSR